MASLRRLQNSVPIKIIDQSKGSFGHENADLCPYSATTRCAGNARGPQGNPNLPLLDQACRPSIQDHHNHQVGLPPTRGRRWTSKKSGRAAGMRACPRVRMCCLMSKSRVQVQKNIYNISPSHAVGRWRFYCCSPLCMTRPGQAAASQSVFASQLQGIGGRVKGRTHHAPTPVRRASARDLELLCP